MAEHPFQELIMMTRDVLRAHPEDRTLPTIVGRLTDLEQNYEVLPQAEAKKLRTLAEPAFEYGIFLGPSVTEEENVMIGHRGVRMEIKLSEELGLGRADLSQGQELVLNSEQNILAVHENLVMPGEVAEVVNVIKPAGAGEVLEVLADRQPPVLRVKRREDEEIEVIIGEGLAPVRETLRKGSIVQLDDDGHVATTLAHPTVHVRGGGGEGSIIEISDALMKEGVQIGNLIRYDPNLKFAFEKVVSNTSKKLALEHVPDVTYEDIGGLEQIVGKIQDAIEMPYIHRAKFRRYDMRRPRGILLSGPPGCGKTMVAKAVANSLTSTIRQHLREREARLALYLDMQARPNDPAVLQRCSMLMGSPAAGQNMTPQSLVQRLREWFAQFDIDPNHAPEELASVRATLNRPDAIRAYFQNVKGPELLSKWVGETERQIREIFEEARRTATFDSPVIIFFDEMESLFRTRGSGRSSDVETTIVPQFLSEIDGVEASENVLVIGATNRQDMIDPAFMRPGRFDRKFEIPRPHRRAALEIMSLSLVPTLPLDENGATARSSAVNNVVFRTAYRETDAASPLAATFGMSDDVRRVLAAVYAVKADVRLVQSLANQGDITALHALAPEMTVGQARTRIDNESLTLKLSRFRSYTLVGDLLTTLNSVLQASQRDPATTQQLTRWARRESVVEALIDGAIEYMYADTSTILVQTVDMAFKPKVRDFVSGATLESVVERAKSLALKRDLADESRTETGIRREDVLDAVKEEFEENKLQLAQYYVQAEQKRPADSIQNVEVTLLGANEDPWIQQKVRPYQSNAGR